MSSDSMLGKWNILKYHNHRIAFMQLLFICIPECCGTGAAASVISILSAESIPPGISGWLTTKISVQGS
jgi:hypothetical protein